MVVVQAKGRRTHELRLMDEGSPTRRGMPEGVAGAEDATLARAVAAGGSVLYPKTAIGTLGFVAEFEDSEGNCIALHSAEA
jgi:predicted enzyme related to lactoylglutathione lyase